jgi:hypothetical protein
MADHQNHFLRVRNKLLRLHAHSITTVLIKRGVAIGKYPVEFLGYLKLKKKKKKKRNTLFAESTYNAARRLGHTVEQIRTNRQRIYQMRSDEKKKRDSLHVDN